MSYMHTCPPSPWAVTRELAEPSWVVIIRPGDCDRQQQAEHIEIEFAQKHDARRP